MKIDIYVLCLLKFKDDKIVFTDEELFKIKNRLEKSIGNLCESRRRLSNGFEVYKLNPENFKNLLHNEVKIDSAELGYYHHRIITYFVLNLNPEPGFRLIREIRSKLNLYVDDIINDIKNGVNTLVITNDIRKDGEIQFFYTYPLITLMNNVERVEAFPFSEEVTTLCFDVVEEYWYGLRHRRHTMRISIPSTIIYAEKKVSNKLLRDVINSIYHYCLYKKKLQDVKDNIQMNVLDENRLIDLWEHLLEIMGGRTGDLFIARITQLTYINGFLLLLLTGILLLLTGMLLESEHIMRILT